MNNKLKLISKVLNNNASEEEVKNLLFMLDHSDFSDWQDIWDYSDSTIDKRTEQKMFLEIKNNIEKHKRFNLRKIRHIAASFILFATSIFAICFYLNAPDKNRYADTVIWVDKGQKAEATLPDGTKVWLNSDTKLSYGVYFNSKKRVINLDGEAYFEIASNPEAPFIVQTSDLSIKALGTSFNVKAYKDENVQTTVLVEGCLEVSTSSEKLTLNPDQRIDYNKLKALLTKSEVTNGTDFSLWKNNQFVFNNDYMSDIILTLSRHYNIAFEFEEEQIKNYKYSGTIANTSLESILQLFSLTSPLCYEIKDSTIVLKENKNTKQYYSKMMN